MKYLWIILVVVLMVGCVEDTNRFFGEHGRKASEREAKRKYELRLERIREIYGEAGDTVATAELVIEGGEIESTCFYHDGEIIYLLVRAEIKNGGVAFWVYADKNGKCYVSYNQGLVREWMEERGAK